MCKVSTDIKFCSCANNVIEEGKNYWVFYRWSGANEEIILGETMLPAGIDLLTDYYNREVLHHRINESSAFDKNVGAQEKDRLLVAIQCPGNTAPLFYGFEFDGEEWQEKDFDPFEWLHFHKNIKRGTVDNGVEKEKGD